jgi:hypothetical protein
MMSEFLAHAESGADTEEKACEHGCTCKPLMEKGCGDHIMALCMGWEQEIARLAKDWSSTFRPSRTQ